MPTGRFVGRFRGRLEDADGGGRTHTPLREPDFESGASAIPPLWPITYRAGSLGRRLGRASRLTVASKALFTELADVKCCSRATNDILETSPALTAFPADGVDQFRLPFRGCGGVEFIHP